MNKKRTSRIKWGEKMKKLRFVIILTLNFIFMSFAYSQNLVEGIQNYDFPTVEKYVEKLGADLNKPLDNFSEKTPLDFAHEYCTSETLEKYFS